MPLALRSGPRVPPPGRAISRNCELIVLNAFLRAKAEIAHQVSRILGAQAALLSTRQAVEEQLKWWEKAYIRDLHGTYISWLENLRRLRLRLVPTFRSKVCLLH
jgi:hypothetical protein